MKFHNHCENSCCKVMATSVMELLALLLIIITNSVTWLIPPPAPIILPSLKPQLNHMVFLLYLDYSFLMLNFIL